MESQPKYVLKITYVCSGAISSNHGGENIKPPPQQKETSAADQQEHNPSAADQQEHNPSAADQQEHNPSPADQQERQQQTEGNYEYHCEYNSVYFNAFTARLNILAFLYSLHIQKGRFLFTNWKSQIFCHFSLKVRLCVMFVCSHIQMVDEFDKILQKRQF